MQIHEFEPGAKTVRPITTGPRLLPAPAETRVDGDHWGDRSEWDLPADWRGAGWQRLPEDDDPADVDEDPWDLVDDPYYRRERNFSSIR